MINHIEHSAFVELYNKDSNIFARLFNDTKLLNTLINKIQKESKNWEKFNYKDENKMMGDLFEIFSECFFKILGADNRIGVCGYTPEKSSEDCGVDAFGTGMDNKPLTVQVKFRSNNETELVSDDIKQFAFQSVKKYKVDIDTRTNMVVFTSANGLNWFTDKNVFVESLRTIGFKEIRTLVDNNICFWNMVRDYVVETIKTKY